MATRTHSFKSPLSHPNKPLTTLYLQVERQKKLLTIIKAVLPEPLASHAQHCLVTETKLLLYTDSAAWASQLRFYHNAILKTLQANTRNRIDLLQIRITESAQAHPEPPKPPINIPSPTQIAAIRCSATGDEKDTLNQALLKLSATLERLSNRTTDTPN